MNVSDDGQFSLLEFTSILIQEENMLQLEKFHLTNAVLELLIFVSRWKIINKNGLRNRYHFWSQYETYLLILRHCLLLNKIIILKRCKVLHKYKYRDQKCKLSIYLFVHYSNISSICNRHYFQICLKDGSTINNFLRVY